MQLAVHIVSALSNKHAKSRTLRVIGLLGCSGISVASGDVGDGGGGDGGGCNGCVGVLKYRPAMESLLNARKIILWYMSFLLRGVRLAAVLCRPNALTRSFTINSQHERIDDKVWSACVDSQPFVAQVQRCYLRSTWSLLYTESTISPRDLICSQINDDNSVSEKVDELKESLFGNLRKAANG
jgi:hypothetical protein